jgi:hypothetical protein
MSTCAICLDMQVWSTEMVDYYGEGQVKTCHADTVGAVKDERET